MPKNGDLNERIKRKSYEFGETVVKAQPDQKVKIDPYMGPKVESDRAMYYDSSVS